MAPSYNDETEALIADRCLSPRDRYLVLRDADENEYLTAKLICRF